VIFGGGKMNNVKKGDIVFSGKRNSNWYSNIVKYVTNSKWSHSFIIAGDAIGELSALEADLDVTLVSWQSQYVDANKDYYKVCRPIKASQEDIDRATKYCYVNYAEEVYGFLQIPWFVYRIYVKKWFGYSPKVNWSSQGMFCSELTYDYLNQLGGEYKELIKGFNPNTASPQDLDSLQLSRLDLFQFILERK
jgi:hypothetical protein